MLRRNWSATLVAVRTVRTAHSSMSPALLALLVLTGSFGCRRDDDTPDDDTSASTVPGLHTVPTAGTPGDTAAPQGATWDLELVEGQLRDAGFNVSRDRTPVNLPFMSVPGTALDLGSAVTVQVYLYGDAAARGADSDKLDATRAAPRTGSVPWRTPATLVTDNNLAAIILTSDASTRSRITDALHHRADGDGALR